MTTTAALYVRQSLDKTGEEAAVERQERDARLLAQAKGWTISRVYADNSISASTGKTRPEFERLVRDIAAGQVNAVVVYHLDRLTRSMADLTRIIEAGKTHHVNITSVHGVSLDLGDPTGVAVASILTAIAAMEVAHKGQRQKSANRQRAAAGSPHWVRRPFGYERKGSGAVIVESEAALIRAAAPRVLAGETMASIVREWNAAGARSTVGGLWNVPNFKKALINPRVAGRRIYLGDDLGPGDWPAILDAETHRRLEEKLSDPRRRTAPMDLSAKYLLTGICRCGVCGAKIYASPLGKQGSKWRRMGYRCEKGCITRNMEPVDEVVEAYLFAVLSRPDAATIYTRTGDVAELRAKAVELRDRRDTLAALLAEGLLSGQAVREQAGKISTELTHIEAAMLAADGLDPLTGLVGPGDVEARWRALSLPVQRQVVRSVINVVIEKAGRGARFSREQVTITPRTP